MHNFKNPIFLFALLVAIVITLLCNSCDLFGKSPTARVNKFASDLNKASERNIYLNFHPDMPGWNTWDDTAFNTTEFSNVDYPGSFSINLTTAVTDTGTPGVKIAYGQLVSSSPLSPQEIQFNFKEQNADDWYILAILLTKPNPDEDYWGTMVY
jgi:hypothetical protein